MTVHPINGQDGCLHRLIPLQLSTRFNMRTLHAAFCNTYIFKRRNLIQGYHKIAIRIGVSLEVEAVAYACRRCYIITNASVSSCASFAIFLYIFIAKPCVSANAGAINADNIKDGTDAR